MPINLVMKTFFLVALFFFAATLFSAPLEAGFSAAPKASASPEEKALAYMEARFRVIDAAMKYEGSPYRYGGLNKNGFDCSGFIYKSFMDALGVSLPRTTTALHSWTEKIPGDMAAKAAAQPGDLLFFKTNSSAKTSHVALYLGNGYFIHSASEGPKTGVIFSTFNDKYWSRNFIGAGRAFPKADDDGFKSMMVSLPLLLQLTNSAAEEAKDDSIGWIRK